MSKHTPGPWKVRDEFNAFQVIDSQGQYVAHVEWPDGLYPARGAETVANARLIVAAPELLEALERTLPLVLLWAEGAGRSHPDYEVAAEARAAIAKATGGQP